MATDAIKRLVTLTARLEAKPALYPDRLPHSLARKLTLPDGSTAPDVLRAWAGFDERYPWAQASRRSTQAIATAEGVVTAKPMSEILGGLRASGEAESADTELSEGHGVLLEPVEAPQRVLWIRAEGEPMIVWHEDKKLARRQAFDEWLVSLFEE
jgi:hypothetical protein